MWNLVAEFRINIDIIGIHIRRNMQISSKTVHAKMLQNPKSKNLRRLLSCDSKWRMNEGVIFMKSL